MMHDITFPRVASATVAIVGLHAVLAASPAEWPVKEQTYYLKEAVPTVSFFKNHAVKVAVEEFAHQIASVFAALSKGQEPLGSEFEAIWDSNVDILYEA